MVLKFRCYDITSVAYNRLKTASEVQHNAKNNQTHTFSFEFVTLNGKTYPIKTAHGHKRHAKGTCFLGGQELFFCHNGLGLPNIAAGN